MVNIHRLLGRWNRLNDGSVDAEYGSLTPVCSSENGLFPGFWNGLEVVGISRVLQQLNDRVHYEGEKVYSIWGDADEMIGYRCLVWGKNSCRLPGQDAEASFAEFDHLDLRDETFDVIYDWIANHE